jgi:PEP-CTERM motif
MTYVSVYLIECRQTLQLRRRVAVFAGSVLRLVSHISFVYNKRGARPDPAASLAPSLHIYRSQLMITAKGLQERGRKMANRLGAIGKLLTAATFAFGLLETNAEAIAILTFDQTTDGGNIAYNGTGGPATGTDVVFDILVAGGTPVNAGTYGCSGCLLNFTTGANTVESAPVAGIRNYQWAGGGSFVLTGTVFDPITLLPIASGTLLTGTFTSAAGFTQVLPGAANDILSFTGQGTDTKHPDLLAFFGIAPDAAFNYSNFEGSGVGTVGGNGSFTGGVNEADLINTEITNGIPEPGSALLLLLGLGSLAAYRRRS